MAYLIGVNLAGADTSPDVQGKKHELNTRTETNGGKRWIYVQASGAIAQYDVVAIDETGQAAQITKAAADDNHKVAVASYAFADDDYGWVQVLGPCTINLIGVSTTADLALYTTATAGSLSPTAASQTKIRGLVATANAGSTSKTATAAFMSTEPQSDGF